MRRSSCFLPRELINENLCIGNRVVGHPFILSCTNAVPKGLAAPYFLEPENFEPGDNFATGFEGQGNVGKFSLIGRC